MTAFRWMRGAALVALLLLGLAACQTPDARLYTLSVLPPSSVLPPETAVLKTTVAAGAPAVLALAALELPPLIDRPQIVRRLDPNRVEALEFDRWAEPLADGLRAALAGDLSARLPGTTLLPVAGAIPAEGTAVLSVTILRFDADATGRVVLDAQWSLAVAGRNGPRHRDTLEIPAEIPARGGEPAALVAAMSRAVAAFADRVAAGARR